MPPSQGIAPFGPVHARASHLAARQPLRVAHRWRRPIRLRPQLAGSDAAAATWWRSQRTWQLLGAAVLVPYLVSLVLVHRPASGYNSLWDGWLGNLAGIVPIVPLVLRGAASRRSRAAWFSLALAVLFYNVGNLVYLFHDQNLVPIPTPAPSDVFFLLEYPFLALGVVLLTQRNFGSVRVSTRLDGAISGLAVASVAALVWFDPVLRVSGHPLQVLVEMAYPVMDLVLLVLLVSAFAPMHYRPTRQAVILMAAVVILVIGDVTYLYRVADGTYVQGTLLDGTWVLAAWLLGVAAWPKDRVVASRSEGDAVPHGVTLVPIAFGSVSLVVLVVSIFHRTTRVTVLLALGALVLIVVRTALTLRDVLVVERRSYRSARVDELTGLPNRRAFFEQANEVMDHLGDGACVGIALVDLDGFKEINDSLGHASGDLLLQSIAARFERVCEGNASVSRIGGDEFACIVTATTPEQLSQLGDALAAAVAEPVELSSMSVRVGASIGLAVGPEHGATLSDLLRCADVAMYRAKLSHTMVRSFHPEDDLHIKDQLKLVDDLHRTEWQRDLVMHYQPTIDLRTGRVLGVEALVRWRHESFGLLYPDDFVPLAERTGLVHELTRAVLARSLDELAHLEALGHRLRMSVNVSRLDLLDGGLAAYVAEQASARGLAPSQLTLEVTETSLGDEPEHAARACEELRRLGVRCSIDDFGVGYSSMSQLLALTVDELKIDRSFVLALAGDPRARAVVTATVEFARALGLTVVAEGVETLRILGIVRRLGVDVGQGYAISVPLSPGQLDAFLARPPILTVPRDRDGY